MFALEEAELHNMHAQVFQFHRLRIKLPNFNIGNGIKEGSLEHARVNAISHRIRGQCHQQ